MTPLALVGLPPQVAATIREWLTSGDLDAVEVESERAAVHLTTTAGAAGCPTPFVVVDVEAGGPELVRALEAGARGYWAEDLGAAELDLAVQTVAEGHAFIPPALLGGLLHDLVQAKRDERPVQDERFDRLSRREREVLDLLAEGKDQVGIARELVISPQTARTHIQNVLGKLEVHSRLEAVALAVEHRQVGNRGDA